MGEYTHHIIFGYKKEINDEKRKALSFVKSFLLRNYALTDSEADTAYYIPVIENTIEEDEDSFFRMSVKTPEQIDIIEFYIPVELLEEQNKDWLADLYALVCIYDENDDEVGLYEYAGNGTWMDK